MRTIDQCAAILAPPPDGDAGAWSEAHRWLPEGSPEPGRYRVARVPYLRAIYEAYSDPEVEEVDVLTASQMGKTDCILNVFGHRFTWGPRVPALYVAPTQDLAKSISEERFRAVIDSTPALAELHERGRRDRVAEKFFAGLRLGFAWAGSKAQLASRPAGLAILDELGRMVADVEGEGSPWVLTRARGKNYPDFTIGTFSTPTLEDADAGQTRFDLGSRFVWEFACLACGERFAPWSRCLRWDKADDDDPAAAAARAAASARLECPACGHGHLDEDKPALQGTGAYRRYRRDLRSGDYHPDPDPPPLGPSRSFWILGLASPWVTFSQLARRLAAAYATHDPETMQAAINTEAGELWRTKGDAPTSAQVAALRMPGRIGSPGSVPAWVQAVTCGVDVQKRSLWYAVRGWGAGLTSHLLAYGEIVGETDYDAVWLLLARLLDQRWRGLGIVRMGVDSGYRPGDLYRRPEHMVYSFARRHRGRVWPTKGHDTQRAPLVASKLEQHGVELLHLDSDHLKTWLHSRINWPADAELGRWTLPEDTSEDYCDQMASEHVLTKASGARVWIAPRRARNHLLDCEAINVAMAYHANLELLTPIGGEPGPARVADDPPGHLVDPSLTRSTL